MSDILVILALASPVLLAYRLYKTYPEHKKSLDALMKQYDDMDREMAKYTKYYYDDRMDYYYTYTTDEGKIIRSKDYKE